MGKIPKYNFRYADDWIILTSKRYEAQRMKKELVKYFKRRLKLELSDEKTKITDMRKNGAVKVARAAAGGGKLVNTLDVFQELPNYS